MLGRGAQTAAIEVASPIFNFALLAGAFLLAADQSVLTVRSKRLLSMRVCTNTQKMRRVAASFISTLNFCLEQINDMSFRRWIVVWSPFGVMTEHCLHLHGCQAVK